LYIVDDIRPLRTLSEEIQKKPLHLFEIADARQYREAQTGGSRFPGNGEYRGQTRPYGALLHYTLQAPGLPHPDDEKERERKEADRAAKGTGPRPEKPAPTPAEKEAAERTSEGKVDPKPTPAEDEEGRRDRKPEAEIQVLDATGKVIRTFKAPAVQGLNRAVWDLRHDAFRQPPTSRPVEDNPWRQSRGPEALPGTYTVKVKYGGQEAQGTMRVLPDPRFEPAEEARRANFAAFQRAGALQNTHVEAIERVVRTREDVRTVAARLRQQEEAAKRQAAGGEVSFPHKDLLASTRKLTRDLDALEARLRQPENPGGILPDNDAGSKLGDIQRSLSSSWDAPTPAQLAYLEEAEETLRAVLADLNRYFADEVAPFRAKVREAGIGLLPEVEALEVKR
ncbi:MAG: hypothetical protein ACLGI9_23755, partial [Thermoanaerobaculia bacterium]